MLLLLLLLLKVLLNLLLSAKHVAVQRPTIVVDRRATPPTRMKAPLRTRWQWSVETGKFEVRIGRWRTVALHRN